MGAVVDVNKIEVVNPVVVDPVTDPVDPADDKTLVPIAELRKVRAEAANNRKELQALKAKAEADAEKARLANLTEVEKAQELLKMAEADNKNLRDSMSRVQIESAITSLASTLGFTVPDDVIRFVDLESVKDEQGNVDTIKIEAAVKDLADKKPYLKSSSAKNFGGPTNPIPPDGPKPKFTDQNSIDALKLKATELTRQGRITEATKVYNLAWEHQQKLIK